MLSIPALSFRDTPPLPSFRLSPFQVGLDQEARPARVAKNGLLGRAAAPADAGRDVTVLAWPAEPDDDGRARGLAASAAASFVDVGVIGFAAAHRASLFSGFSEKEGRKREGGALGGRAHERLLAFFLSFFSCFFDF